MGRAVDSWQPRPIASDRRTEGSAPKTRPSDSGRKQRVACDHHAGFVSVRIEPACIVPPCETSCQG